MDCIFKSSPDWIFLDRFIKDIYVETEKSHNQGVYCWDGPFEREREKHNSESL